ncbi:MAG TPA: DUF4065 domain-containing protein [Rickettsia endosymbiont of Pyrocoelia pectoralis]|nr:DUF4065 domain-containing protein [Rickettsia endosymbiont of Pyrocoelia pectoralis]
MNTKLKEKALSCFDVANYFLVLVDREAGDTITQLKLQKLIYFAQGVHLALFDKPLFEEEIEAWKHGPVAPKLRIPFGNLKDGPIAAPGEMDFDIYTEQQKNFIYKIYSIYGEHTASYLRKLTHTHSIWQEAINNPDNHIITKKKIQEFFKTNVIKDIENLLLANIQEDSWQIELAEDQWWMNYDSGVPAEDIADQLLELKKELEEGK